MPRLPGRWIPDPRGIPGEGRRDDGPSRPPSPPPHPLKIDFPNRITDTGARRDRRRSGCPVAAAGVGSPVRSSA
ncbi:hypothetical protein VQ02_22395 [Methylobacterium variabile]|uniref:Uncharacterized protein n=1 Tax=Methylobacterium variabile TaxID=298794 RepID=A0A0J6SGY8_9HYPH|nr:hypothetical protein VQ02_22395 [Methylobacterium variabile]